MKNHEAANAAPVQLIPLNEASPSSSATKPDYRSEFDV